MAVWKKIWCGRQPLVTNFASDSRIHLIGKNSRKVVERTESRDDFEGVTMSVKLGGSLTRCWAYLGDPEQGDPIESGMDRKSEAKKGRKEIF